MTYYPPTTKYEEEFVERFTKNNMEIGDGFNSDPHPFAEKLIRDLVALDWCFYSDTFRFKLGGDGDSGERLMEMISVLMRLYEKETHETLI